MNELVFQFPKVKSTALSCVWIETRNPAQPLACVWIDRDLRLIANHQCRNPGLHPLCA